MMSDQVSPLVVRQAARDLPEDRSWSLHGAPPVCTIGAAFVDELYRERRISSVEWRALRDAIWPQSHSNGALLTIRTQPSPSSDQQAR